MTQRSQLPKFGNWENEDNVPYTVDFENARKGRSGNKMNPSNPNMVSNDRSPVEVTSSERKAELEVVNGPETGRSRQKRHMGQEDGELTPVQTTDIESSRQHHGGVTPENNEIESEANKAPDASTPSDQRRLSREDGDLRKPYNSPLRHDTIGKKDTADSPRHRLGDGSTESPKRVSRQNLGSERSIEQSPLHPHHQARIGNRSSGVSSPSWERKATSEGTHGVAPFTPGRSRLRSSVTGGDETPDNGPAVPKFGDWDESDPSAAEGYTHIFNRVREEKQSGTGKVPIMATETSYSNGSKQYANGNSKGCLCFPWGRK